LREQVRPDVAEVHRASPVRDSLASRDDHLAARWLLLPPASGPECVTALQRAGFRVRLEEGDQVLMVKDDRVVCVPLVERIRPEQLVTIVQNAGVSVADFTAFLDD
jgi:hypothetical protein